MPHATPGSDCHVPGKRSIFGIAGDRPCMPWLSPHQLPQALWEDIWEKTDMPNQKSYEVSIYPDSTPGEPMPDPAVGAKYWKRWVGTRAGISRAKRKRWPKAKSMYETLVEVKPKVRMRVMVKVITKEPNWEIYIRLIPLHPVTQYEGATQLSVGERVVGRKSALCLGLSRVAPLRA